MKPVKPNRVSVDRESLIIDVRRELDMPSRRLFGKRIVTLGGLAMLAGCSISDDKSVETFLSRVSRLNDTVQGWLFDPNRLAPTYTEAQITRPFPFNAFYGIDDVPVVDGSDFRLKVSGLVQNTKTWTLPELYALPKAEQITRHICVEGWSAIGRLGRHAVLGVPEAGGSGHIGEICWFQMRGRLLRKHRHADCLAFADTADVHLRRPAIAAKIWLPDET